MKTAAISLLIALLVPFDAHAGIYKCINASGVISFSDEPCKRKSSASQGKAVSFHANVLVVKSKADIEDWVKRAPKGRGKDLGRLRVVARGVKLYLPIVATFARSQVGERIALVADMEVSGPGGRHQKLPSCCFANRVDPRAPATIVLEPIVDVTFDATDPSGDYTVRATIDNGEQTAVTRETFRLQ